MQTAVQCHTTQLSWIACINKEDGTLTFKGRERERQRETERVERVLLTNPWIWPERKKESRGGTRVSPWPADSWERPSLMTDQNWIPSMKSPLIVGRNSSGLAEWLSALSGWWTGGCFTPDRNKPLAVSH